MVGQTARTLGSKGYVEEGFRLSADHPNYPDPEMIGQLTTGFRTSATLTVAALDMAVTGAMAVEAAANERAEAEGAEARNHVHDQAARMEDIAYHRGGDESASAAHTIHAKKKDDEKNYTNRLARERAMDAMLMSLNNINRQIAILDDKINKLDDAIAALKNGGALEDNEETRRLKEEYRKKYGKDFDENDPEARARMQDMAKAKRDTYKDQRRNLAEDRDRILEENPALKERTQQALASAYTHEEKVEAAREIVEDLDADQSNTLYQSLSSKEERLAVDLSENATLEEAQLSDSTASNETDFYEVIALNDLGGGLTFSSGDLALTNSDNNNLSGNLSVAHQVQPVSDGEVNNLSSLFAEATAMTLSVKPESDLERDMAADKVADIQIASHSMA